MTLDLTPKSKALLHLSLAVLSGLLAIGLGFLTPQGFIKNAFRGGAYYIIFATFIIWILTWMPNQWSPQAWQSFLKKHGLAALLSVLLSIGSVLTSPPEFRILADETNLMAIASAMFDDQQIYNPTQGEHYYHRFHKKGHEWGKRPVFFPFLVSVTHTLVGYSPYNGFVLNAIAGAGLFFIFYLLLCRWFSTVLAISGMILLAAYPLLTLWITSSGFEVVNLFFMVLAFFLLDRFLVSQKTRDAELLGLTLVLLAQIRYESVIVSVVLLVGLLMCLRWKHLENLTFRGILLPLMFLPIAWQRMLTLDNKYYQVDQDKPLFGWIWFEKNMGLAWEFFMRELERYPVIPLVFLIALLGMFLSIHWTWKHPEHRSTLRFKVLAGTAAMSFLLQVVVIFSYFWGDLTLQYAMRLGLVFLPFFIVWNVFVCSELTKRYVFLSKYVLVGSIACLLYYWPVAAKNEAVLQIFVHREYRTALDFLYENYPDKNIMVISDRPGMYTFHRWGARNFDYARENKKTILKQMKRHMLTDVVVIQKIQYRTKRPKKGMNLPNYSLKPLYELQLNNKEFLRFSKVLRKS